MRFSILLTVLAVGICFGSSALAKEPRETELPFEFRLVNADGQTVAEGYMSLGWDGCSGDLFAFSGENVVDDGTGLWIDADMQGPSKGGVTFPGLGVPKGHPVHVAFWGGEADFSLLGDDVYELLFCNPCGVSRCPLERCCGCADGCFYLYETQLCLPDGVLYARVWMPRGMAFELTTIGGLGVVIPFPESP